MRKNIIHVHTAEDLEKILSSDGFDESIEINFNTSATKGKNKAEGINSIKDFLFWFEDSWISQVFKLLFMLIFPVTLGLGNCHIIELTADTFMKIMFIDVIVFGIPTFISCIVFFVRYW